MIADTDQTRSDLALRSVLGFSIEMTMVTKQFPLRGHGHRVPRNRVQESNHRREPKARRLHLLRVLEDEREHAQHDPARPHLIRRPRKPPDLRNQQEAMRLAIQLQRIQPQDRHVRP